MQVKVSDSYKVGTGDWDAMHAFESRVVNDKSVTVGGVHTKINAALKDFYTTKKLNPYVSSIKVTMDKNAYTVNWEVTIEESPDGVAWVGITSRGGAGPRDGDSGSIKRAFRQILKKKKELPSEVDKNSKITDIYDFFFKFSSSGAVRQIFVQYTSPSSYPNLPKSGNVQSGQVGKSIPIEVGAENNGKVVFTSQVGPSNPVDNSGQTGTNPVDNSGQTGTNPQASVSNPVDGTAIPTGGSFDFVLLKDSERKEIGFISFPPRRSGSIPVVIIYPKTENLDLEETFELGKEKVTGKHSGIKMAKLVNSWQNSLGQSANENWIPDVVSVIGNKSKSPIENWFSKWCLVFANEPDTDFKSLLNLVETELDFRSMTTSSFNFVIHGDSANNNTGLFEALSGETFVKKTKTLLLLESLPDVTWGVISKKIKSHGGQVYYVYNSQNFKIDITKTVVAGISYSTPISLTGSSIFNSNPILFFDNTPGLTQTTTVSVAKYNQTFGVTGSQVYSPFPLIPYKSLPLSQSVGLSPSVMVQNLDIPFIDGTSFKYTTLAEDIYRENGFVYDLSKNPVENYKLYGGSASWPEVNLVNGQYKLNLPQPQIPVVSTPSNVGSPSNTNPLAVSPSIPEINIKYVLSHLQAPNLDSIPQLGFQIFYSDIEKNIGQSTTGVSGSATTTQISGQFIFDVRKKGYLINDQLGEFKIVEKVEIDPFELPEEEEIEDMSLLAPEYLEGEFFGDDEVTESFAVELENINVVEGMAQAEKEAESLPPVDPNTPNPFDNAKGSGIPPSETGQGYPVDSKTTKFVNKHTNGIYPAKQHSDGTFVIKNAEGKGFTARHWLVPNPQYVKLMKSVSVPLSNGTKKDIQVHPEFANKLKTAFEVIERQGLQKWIFSCAGGLAIRNVTKGIRLSNHSYGFAIDINSSKSGWEYGSKWDVSKKTLTTSKGVKRNWGPEEEGFYKIVNIMKNYEIGWLGSMDPMHFSIHE